MSQLPLDHCVSWHGQSLQFDRQEPTPLQAQSFGCHIYALFNTATLPADVALGCGAQWPLELEFAPICPVTLGSSMDPPTHLPT
mmetsp:Transcript_70392/g.124078  ORF Transcript_70392/g.124078 Transcript_70392/m.124078 type:complete len:84 (+) Transcript_70392:732-983(+)